MRFHIVTLFPNMFSGLLGESILKRACEKKLLSVNLINPRDYAIDKHKTADDKPYGGGPGMVLKAEPILKAVQKATSRRKKVKVLIMSPHGKQFTNDYARSLLKKYNDVVLICGHYEGIDARVKKVLKAEDVSVGPYIVTGGELPAMIILDSVSRQISGVLGTANSLEETRTASREVYTRPETFGWKGKQYAVPKVLLSGDHKEIEEWRKKNTYPQSSS